jgi:hypothetical protein
MRREVWWRGSEARKNRPTRKLCGSCITLTSSGLLIHLVGRSMAFTWRSPFLDAEAETRVQWWQAVRKDTWNLVGHVPVVLLGYEAVYVRIWKATTVNITNGDRWLAGWSQTSDIRPPHVAMQTCGPKIRHHIEQYIRRNSSYSGS